MNSPYEYASHPDYKSILWGVLEDPDDDAPRLVLADWLDEFGGEQGERRAGIIREQLEKRTTEWDVHENNLPRTKSFSRGFQHRAYYQTHTFTEENMRNLFAQEPITDLILQPTPIRIREYGRGDDRATIYSQDFYWVFWSFFTNYGHYDGGMPFVELLFSSVSEAIPWLSRQCVNWGRSLVDLPLYKPESSNKSGSS